MTIGSDMRNEHFERLYQETQDFGRVQFVEKIEDLENKIEVLENNIESLEEDCRDYENNISTYEGYEEQIDSIYNDIETFMYKLKMDKCYTKELEIFIKHFGGDLFREWV